MRLRRPGATRWFREGCCRPSDLIVFALLYVLTDLGVTVGFDPVLHSPEVRFILAALGPAATEGQVVSLVAR